jgi:hypothetical protein
MTGPEHYQRAEELLSAGRGEGERADRAANRIAEAQVHATLALAAATALAQSDDVEAHRAWQRAAGEQPTVKDPREEWEEWERNRLPETRSRGPSWRPQPMSADEYRRRQIDPDTDM